MKRSSSKGQLWAVGAIMLLAAWLPTVTFAEPTNGPLVALGLTNVPIGSATLEIIENGVLFVGNTEDGAGVSVHLAEADSGVFLYPLTGYLYQDDAMEGKAYGRVNGATNQFISSVRGVHNGDQSATVTVDFSSLGTSRLSVFVDGMLLGKISNSTVDIRVQGDGYGCRANPWWRLPDGRFGALVELAQNGAAIAFPAEAEERSIAGSSIFIHPDDPTNSVDFVSRVDVTSTSLGSFCLTDARVGMFHQRHKALGQATLYPVGGQLVIGNAVSENQDGVLVELAGVTAFDVDLLPLELTGTNAAITVSGFGSYGTSPHNLLGTARIGNRGGLVQINMELGPASETTEILVRSNGVAVGSALVSNNVAAVELAGSPHVTGYAFHAKTMDTRAGIAVRVDRSTTFTLPGGEAFLGDEVSMHASEHVFFDSLESFVMLVNEIPSVTITGETESIASAPELKITRSPNGVTLAWPDPNRVYSVEAATALDEGFLSLPDEPAFADNHCQLTVSSEGTQYQFFRLRRQPPSSD